MPGRIEIHEDRQALALRLAEWLTERALAAPGAFRVALSGGSTPQALYALLASGGFRERFPWQRAEWFWGDERFVPHDHPESNYGAARRLMLDHVPAPAPSIHPVPCDGTPHEAARRYERTLRRAYGATLLDSARPLFDVNLLGLGADGHTASLLPGDPALEERDRWVVAVTHGRPEPRISLTLPALESSRSVVFMVAGAEKAGALAAVRAGDVRLPAARLRPRGELVWFVDRAAADGDALERAAARLGSATILVIMGVSGAGKSTLARELAARLGWDLQEGDELHPAENVERMRAGVPLDDAARAPWLAAVAAWIDGQRAAGRPGVITCSALKRAYRRVIVGGRPGVALVFLRGEREVIARRLAGRADHVMPAGLLQSQFDALEEPGTDEHALTVDVGASAADLVERIVQHLA